MKTRQNIVGSVVLLLVPLEHVFETFFHLFSHKITVTRLPITNRITVVSGKNHNTKHQSHLFSYLSKSTIAVVP